MQYALFPPVIGSVAVGFAGYGICSLPLCDWLPHQEYALFPPVIGSVAVDFAWYGICSSPLRLAPTSGICSVPPCNWLRRGGLPSVWWSRDSGCGAVPLPSASRRRLARSPPLNMVVKSVWHTSRGSSLGASGAPVFLRM
eukprot:1196366-Prorocentrum_minimum.AAC.1